MENVNGGISVDFTDVLLIINVFAIAMLLGVLYVDEIVVTLKRAAHCLSPHALYLRMRFWFDAYRTPH
jgi:hypothetical protein